MKTTIVYAHPWEESFNRAVLNEACKAEKDYYLIDLYKDGFDPAMSSEDLALYGRGKSADPMVDTYNKMLDDTDKIIFIFPIWWYDMPAMMRGFLDKVMLEGSGYHTGAAGLTPVRDIQKTYLFTTSSTPTEGLIQNFGDPINGTMIAGTFEILGFHNAKWINLGGIDGTTEKEREEYLANVKRILAGK